MTYYNEAKSIEKKAIESMAPLRNEKYINKCINELTRALIPVNFQTESWLEEAPSSYGIYMFWVSSTKSGYNLDTLRNEWTLAKSKVKFTPRFNQRRANKIIGKYKKFKKIPFYLGKSEKIKNRIEQHSFLKAESGTYALKLDAMRNANKQILGLDFYVSFLPFPFSPQSSFLLAIIESSIRNKLNPVIGRQ